MTKIVKKGAGRPSAMARKSKLDLRTPLSAKGTIKDPKETRRKREDLADDITEGRAVQFKLFADTNGWWTGIEFDKDVSRTVVTCKRDDGRYKETITAEWIEKRVPDGGVNYSVVGGRTIRLRNVSAARQVIDGSVVIDKNAPQRKERKSNVVRITGPNGEEQTLARYGRPVGADIVDKHYHLKAVRPKNRTDLAPVIHQFPAGEQQKRSFITSCEADGYIVTVTEHERSDCPTCAGKTEEKARPEKRAVKSAPSRKAPARKAAARRRVPSGDGTEDLKKLLSF